MEPGKWENSMNGNRILSIELKNIKTVQNGTVESSLKKPVERGELENHLCDIVGIYGQNGSGKTTVIDALGFLKNLAQGIPLNLIDPRTGRRVEGDYDYLLDVNSDSGSLLFTCLIYVGEEPYEIHYSIPSDNALHPRQPCVLYFPELPSKDADHSAVPVQQRAPGVYHASIFQ